MTMTTHHVEIRRTEVRDVPNGALARPWHEFTRAPIHRRDAELLLSMVNTDYWEVRVVAIAAPMGQEFAELERRVGTAPPRRWEKVAINHHPDCHLMVAPDPRETWKVRVLGDDLHDIFTAVEWMSLQALRGAVRAMNTAKTQMPQIRQVVMPESPSVHVGECDACGAVARALSIKITVHLDNGTSSCREYAL